MTGLVGVMRVADRREYGELVITRLNDPTHTEPFACTCLEIQQADPRIRIAAEMLEQRRSSSSLSGLTDR